MDNVTEPHEPAGATAPLGPPTAWDGAIAAARAVWIVTAVLGGIALVVLCLRAIADGDAGSLPSIALSVAAYGLMALVVMLAAAVPTGAVFARLNIVDWFVLAAPFVGVLAAYLTVKSYAALVILPASVPLSLVVGVLYASNVRFLRPR